MEQAFEEADIDEEEALRGLIERKYKDIADLSFEDRQKVIKKLMAKGFSYDAIKAVI